MNRDLSLLPSLITVTQHCATRDAPDFEALLSRDLPAAVGPTRPGARLAVAVGSRGIANLQSIVRAVLRALESGGARPFILPAMGSHGGATPGGQAALLAEYGITEAELGVPLATSMEVQEIGSAFPGFPVVVGREALASDGVVLVNRIKPHTDFAGSLGSGLLKMLVVGLGKHVGAAQFHAASSRLGYEHVLRAHAGLALGVVRVLAGVAIIEDQRHQTAHLEVVRTPDLLAREPHLCAHARSLMPRLPFRDIDLLIVDRMGKNLSGTGMDPAVIGRMIHGYSLAEDAPHLEPRVRRLFVRDLTPESHGNAIGIGLADFTTSRLVRAIDRSITSINALTALSLQGAKVPLHFDTDHEALAAAAHSLALPDLRQARIVRIRDTLSLDRLQVSSPLLPELAGRTDFEAISQAAPLAFDRDGNLGPFPA